MTCPGCTCLLPSGSCGRLCDPKLDKQVRVNGWMDSVILNALLIFKKLYNDCLCRFCVSVIFKIIILDNKAAQIRVSGHFNMATKWQNLLL